MKKELRSGIVILLIMTGLTGIVYPLGVTAVAKLLFPHQSQGSLIVENGQAVGSELIGQSFDDPRYLWGRLSATAPVSYNAAASSGSNYGPMNPVLVDAVRQRIQALSVAGNEQSAVPVDLVTSSASGLDPHISPSAAQYQVKRIIQASGISESVLQKTIRDHTESRTLGILGESRVNVLLVNLDLRKLYNDH